MELWEKVFVSATLALVVIVAIVNAVYVHFHSGGDNLKQSRRE